MDTLRALLARLGPVAGGCFLVAVVAGAVWSPTLLAYNALGNQPAVWLIGCFCAGMTAWGLMALLLPWRGWRWLGRL